MRHLFPLFFLFSVLAYSTSLIAQTAGSAHQASAAMEWLTSSGINLNEQAEKFCELINGKDIPLNQLVHNNSPYIAEAVEPNLKALVAKHQGKFAPQDIEEGIRNLVLLKAAEECPAFQEIARAQTIAKLHKLYRLNANQANLLDEVGETVCPCTNHDEDCIRQKIEAKEREVSILFPEKDGVSSVNQVYNILAMWKSLGCK